MSQAYTWDSISDWSVLARIAPQWDELWERAQGAYLIESFGWARLSWELPPDTAARRLFCVTAHQDGVLKAICPFVIERGKWRVARPIETLWGDYSTVLAETPELVEATWRYIQRHCPADLIHLPFVRDSSPLHRVVAGSGLHLYSLAAPFVSWQGVSDWDGFMRTRSADQRRDLRRKHRRLEEAGKLAFEEVTDPEAAKPVIDWMLLHKARWLDYTGKEDATWVRNERFRQFLYELMGSFGPAGRCILFTLRQNDQIIAADLSSIDHIRVGWYMGTFDQALRRYSPGNVLKEYTLKWAFDRGLQFDMRLGAGEHKQFWCTDIEQTSTWRCPVSVWGRAYVLAKKARALAKR